MSHVITRMPPSPTGLFHVGSARTALYNFLFARQAKGKFILRIEDTDQERSKKEFEENIIESLGWLGLNYDNGPLRQSERGEIYKKYLEKLIASGAAYISKEEPKEEDERSEVIRFKNPNTKIRFIDLVLGEIEVDTTDLKDFVIAKDLDHALYHFAVVVDDIEMGITHVIRGQDHVSNTPRQILILEALGGRRPEYAHIPLILSPDRAKLSKRHGAVSIMEYKELGYLPQAILNFLALIGWNPGSEREVFTLAELIEEFSLNRVQKGGGVFNLKKLDWMNREHIKLLPPKEIEKNILERLPENMRNPKLVPVIFERISKWGDVETMVAEGELDFFFEAPKIDKSKLNFKGASEEETKRGLEVAHRALKDLKDFSAENIKSNLMLIAENLSKRGVLLHPVRYALCGREKSPDPFVIASILGKDETLRRLQNAI